MNWLLPMVVFLPMIGAGVSYLVGRKSKPARNAFVCALTAFEFILAALALATAASGQVLTFDWAYFAGFGLHFKLDGFRALYVAIAAFMWMMTGLFSPQYFAHYHNRNRYYFFTLMTLGATAGVFLSDDLYTTFIFFEVMSFTSYTWVAHEENPGAMKAAETYLAIAVVGGMVTLMGLFMTHHLIGSLSFEALLHAGEHMAPSQLYLPGILVMFGFAAKAGAFPVHIWLPKAHPVAPAPASALLSGVLTKAGIFGVLVTSCNLFLHNADWGNGVLIIGLITMFLGALLALFSIDLKRTLACSSMSQIGFILVGVGMQGLLGHHNALAVQGTLLHMVNHSLIKLCLFMAAGAVYMNLHKLNLNDIRGFGRNKPVLHVAFLMGVLGISGVPLWNGYISKTLLHESIVEYVVLLNESGLNSLWYSVAEWVFIITGGMTFCYMLKLYISLCWEKHPTRQEEFDAKKKTYLKPLSRIALGGAAIVLPILGFFPDVFMTGMAELGQSFMHGHSPAHHVEYFSWVNLWGTFKSLIIGGVLYVGVVRTVFKRKGDYVNLWPAWLDMENILFRSRFSYVTVPGVITKVSRFMDNLATSKFVTVVLAGIVTGVTRAADEITDGAALLVRKTVLAHKKKKQPVPVGNRFTYTLGRSLDGVAALLNKTILRRRPIQTNFEYVFDAGRKEMRRERTLIRRSMSFGLLLLCVGLYLTCWYLLQ